MQASLRPTEHAHRWHVIAICMTIVPTTFIDIYQDDYSDAEAIMWEDFANSIKIYRQAVHIRRTGDITKRKTYFIDDQKQIKAWLKYMEMAHGLNIVPVRIVGVWLTDNPFIQTIIHISFDDCEHFYFIVLSYRKYEYVNAI